MAPKQDIWLFCRVFGCDLRVYLAQSGYPTTFTCLGAEQTNSPNPVVAGVATGVVEQGEVVVTRDDE
ncbi:MAG: hypothetical protein NTZ28_04065 [Nitrospirae bacterium]|nr:hypothetical protein [Nitrospirota bacterium]